MAGEAGKTGRAGRERPGADVADGGCTGSVLLFPSFPSFPSFRAFAQTDPRLVEAIRQAQEGGGDSARAKVRRLLAATSPTDTLYPQIIYTQAMVASDANEMRRQLQRVAVEYSSSSWADDALLRLVQLDYASGNLPGAARNLERIRQDYPGSTLLPQSAYWAARTYFDQKNPELACRWISDGLAGSTGQRRAAESARLPGSALRRGPGRRRIPPAPRTRSPAGVGEPIRRHCPPDRTDPPPHRRSRRLPRRHAPPRTAATPPPPPRSDPPPVASRPVGRQRPFQGSDHGRSHAGRGRGRRREAQGSGPGPRDG